MIRVDRDRLAQDGSQIRPQDSWSEKADAARRTAIAEGAAHEVSDLYRDDAVRMALEKLFHDKCAYCESRLGAACPWEVEHYRPKKGVAERVDHPGYYWLAYDWSNLYPACTYCNQRRRDLPRWDEPVTLPAAGKAILFPLADEAQRAMSPNDDLARERPLLLDPCSPDEDPEQHLLYDVQGQILPRHAGDLRAEATIRICHLKRRRLRDDRLKVLLQTVQIVKILRQARAAKVRNEVLTGLEDLLNGQLDAAASHAGVARVVVRNLQAFEL